VLVFRSGGYYPAAFGTAAIVLLVAAAVAAIAIAGSWKIWQFVALFGLLGFSAWQLVAASHADDAALGHQAATLSALYAAAGGLTLLGMRRAWLPRLVDGALLVASAAGLAGLASRLFPSFGADTESRLAWPLTYWNALGAAAGFGIVLAVGTAGAPSRSPFVRSAAAAVVPPLALTLVMTFSRGGALVLLVGTLVVLALAPGRIETLAALAACAAPAAVLIWLATRENGLVEIAGSLPPHAAAGHRIALDALCASLIAASLCALGAKGVALLSPAARRGTGVGLASLAVGCAVVGLVVFSPSGGYAHAVSKAKHDFTSQRRPLTGSRTSAYLSASGSHRWSIWLVANEEWRSARITGTGPGDFRFWWDERRRENSEIVNAHNLYLETLAESGVIGLGLVLLVPLSLVAGVVALRRRARTATIRESTVAAGAALGIFAHAAVDWDWQFPAVMLPAIVLVFGVTRAAYGGTGRRPTRWVPGLAVPFAVLALLLAGGVLAVVDVDRGKHAAASGDLTKALTLAQSAIDHDSGASEPRRLEANVLADLGRETASNRAFAAAVARSPSNFVIYDDWASVLLARGDDRAARPLLRRARQLNPMDRRTRLLAQIAGLPVPAR
jgi:hypothetical protein